MPAWFNFEPLGELVAFLNVAWNLGGGRGLCQPWIYVCSWQASEKVWSKRPHRWNGHKEQQKGNSRKWGGYQWSGIWALSLVRGVCLGTSVTSVYDFSLENNYFSLENKGSPVWILSCNFSILFDSIHQSWSEILASPFKKLRKLPLAMNLSTQWSWNITSSGILLISGVLSRHVCRNHVCICLLLHPQHLALSSTQQTFNR